MLWADNDQILTTHYEETIDNSVGVQNIMENTDGDILPVYEISEVIIFYLFWANTQYKTYDSLLISDKTEADFTIGCLY